MKVVSLLALCFFYQTVTTNIILNAAFVDVLLVIDRYFVENYQCEQYPIVNLLVILLKE